MLQPAELKHLKEVSARVGRDMTLVQGAGGNTSVKDGDVLWVKASGAWLSEADKREIFVPVDLPGALRALGQGIEKMPVADPTAKLRPAVNARHHVHADHRPVRGWWRECEIGEGLVEVEVDGGIGPEAVDAEGWHAPMVPAAQSKMRSRCQVPRISSR